MIFYFSVYFFSTHTATTEIYTLSLHDALPIWPIDTIALAPSILTLGLSADGRRLYALTDYRGVYVIDAATRDRKSTRLNSSHQIISYAVFCLKKKKKH